jgi:Domain of unknown function (DUF4185)
MGAAAYIGRVGGLAVALGVGTAIATGYGVASAETTDSTTSSSTNTSTTDPSPTGTAAVDPTTTPETTGSETTTTGTTTATTVESGQVSAQTNTGTSGTTETTETADEPEVDEEEPTTELPETPDPETPDPETPDPVPTETAEPTEPQEPTAEPEIPQDEPDTVDTSKSDNQGSAALPAAEPTSTPSANTVESLPDPASTVQEADKVAVFADARALAAVSSTNISPMMAAQATQSANTRPTAAVAPAPQDLFTAVANVVSSVVNWVVNPLASFAPSTPAEPPLIWGLLAFARREVENFFNALAGRSGVNAVITAAQTTTSLALAAVPPVNPRPGFPIPGQQLSPSTNFVDWVTGNYQPNETQYWYGVTGTDIGVIWDNGMVDNPATPFNEHQVLMAFGDTFGIRGYPGDHWRPNILFRSADATLADGISLTDPEWFTGNDFGGSPLTWVPDGAPYQYHARQIIFPEGLPAGVTLIPTAGISVPTPGTEYGVTQYISFMSVTQWGAPGQWTTNYSAIAYSTDNGEVWKVAPQTVRYNQPWSGNQNFQQSAFVRPGDGYVYVYGTPNGRQGAAHLARVAERDILDLTKYEYYSAGTPGGWFGWGATPAGWHRNNPAAATAVFGVDTGACGIANPGNQVSEMSVQYNKSLKKYVVLYGDQFNNIVMRTSDTPQGGWSSAKVLMGQQNGGIYAPMMHPWSPSTQGTGSDLYWNLSLWSEYNVMLMRTDLTKV